MCLAQCGLRKARCTHRYRLTSNVHVVVVVVVSVAHSPAASFGVWHRDSQRNGVNKVHSLASATTRCSVNERVCRVREGGAGLQHSELRSSETVCPKRYASQHGLATRRCPSARGSVGGLWTDARYSVHAGATCRTSHRLRAPRSSAFVRPSVSSRQLACVLVARGATEAHAPLYPIAASWPSAVGVAHPLSLGQEIIQHTLLCLSFV